ncbi:MAG: zinc-dependent metalloprotease, partial [Chitinophagaceae bacterium]
KEAVNFLNKNLFTTPMWLINNEVFDRTGANEISTIGGVQDATLNSILSASNLSKLIDAEAELGGAKAYTMLDLLGDLKKGIFSELPGRQKIDVYRRNLQKSYVSILDDLLGPPSGLSSGATVIIFQGGFPGVNTEKSDIMSAVRAHLTSLRAEARAAAAATVDPMTKYHLQDIAARIDKALDPKN